VTRTVATSNAPPPSVVGIKGNDSLPFYNGNKSPHRKKVSPGTQRKRVANKLKQKYEAACALGRAFPCSIFAGTLTRRLAGVASLDRSLARDKKEKFQAEDLRRGAEGLDLDGAFGLELDVQ